MISHLSKCAKPVMLLSLTTHARLQMEKLLTQNKTSLITLKSTVLNAGVYRAAECWLR